MRYDELTPFEHEARTALQSVPPWAQARESGGVAPAMALACAPDCAMTVAQMGAALARCARKGVVVRVSRGRYAMADWPSAREAP